MRRGTAAGDSRGDRVARAYETLRTLIVQGRLAPGTRIIESEVAQRLQMSRTPVRSALHRLQQEGYIQGAGQGRQSRLTVSPLTQEDASELFGIVAEIEGLAARRAAELPADGRDALVETMRGLNREIAGAAVEARPDPARILELDMRFHRSYVDAGGGPRLLALHDAIKPQADRYIQLYVHTLTSEINVSVEEHRSIVSALERGEPDGAQYAVQTNWRNAAERLSQVIATLGERGIW